MAHPVYSKYLARQRRINSFKFWARVTSILALWFATLLLILWNVA
jgi:hypothetical protein